MCGYCTESAALSELLEEMKGEFLGVHDPILYPVRLQEASDWRTELGAWESLHHPRGALVALCRQWSECIAGMSPAPLAEALDTDAFTELQCWLVPLGYSLEWRQALSIDGRPQNPLPIDLARTKLDAYINGWIQPQPCDAGAWDHKKLAECFLGVSITLDVVAQCAKDDARLELLATSHPNQTPMFDALDLWLQRRALHACVAHSGVGFIRAHLDKLRSEAILSVVMSDLLTPDDLLEVLGPLQGRSRD